MTETNRHLLLVFGLGTFHASLLLLFGIVFLYAEGGLAGLLDDLSTLAGLLAFAWLWFASFLGTSYALRSVDQQAIQPSWEYLAKGAFGGAVAGAAFFAGLAAVIAVSFFVDPSPENSDLGRRVAATLFLVFAFGGFGSIFAALVGAFAGIWVAILDNTLLYLTRTLIRSA